MVLSDRGVGQRAGLLIALAPLVLLAVGCVGASSTTENDPPLPRAPHWAAPLQRPGAPNLHKVSDGLYRGAQPTAEGFRELKAMGVTTVLNLRSAHSDADEIGDTDLAYEHIWFRTWHPEDEDVVRFLHIVTDSEKIPVFVHCHRGSDRTGMMCAIYRVVVCGWSKDEAIREMVHGGFDFHPGFPNLIDYVRDVDVDKMKRLMKQDCGEE